MIPQSSAIRYHHSDFVPKSQVTKRCGPKKSRITAASYYDTDRRGLMVAYARCSLSDNFNKAIGRKIARQRLLSFLERGVGANYIKVYYNVSKFNRETMFDISIL